MNIEPLSFSLLAAALGMAVVFLFLGILSLLMAAIRRLFANSDHPARADADALRREAGGRTAGGADPGGLPDWAVAAVAALLTEEEREARPSAARWRPEPGGEAWVLSGRRG